MAQLTSRAYTVLDPPKKKNLFVIMEAPTDDNLDAYLQKFAENNVKHVIKACPEVTYDAGRLAAVGIEHHDLIFNDGEMPQDSTIQQWCEVVKKNSLANVKKPAVEREAVAVHCVAGLGRAPLLVAIALINDGANPEDAITLIRSKRKGALNNLQCKFLQDTYKPPKKACVIQ